MEVLECMCVTHMNLNFYIDDQSQVQAEKTTPRDNYLENSCAFLLNGGQPTRKHHHILHLSH